MWLVEMRRVKEEHDKVSPTQSWFINLDLVRAATL